MMKQTILVIGATGMLGKPVADKLHENGFNVRVLTRQIDKAKKVLGDSFEYVQGDVTDNTGLNNALSDCYGVHINLSGEYEDIGVINIVNEARKVSSIKRITYISGTSVHLEGIWFHQTKRKYNAERAIMGSGIPFTIFCPTWFMESLPLYVKGENAFVFGKQPNLYHFIAVDDYATMVARSYTSEEAKNKRFFIHGPEGILFKKALKDYCTSLGKDIEPRVMSYFGAKIISLILNKPEMRNTSKLMQYFEKIGELGDPTEANNILGAPKTTLKKWLEEERKSAG